MRLGWRNPRPNDFQGPDARPLRDQFADLQRFMTWPHVRASIAAGTPTGGFAAKPLTPVDDPFTLCRVANQIQVPRDFDAWLMVAYANARMASAGGGLYQIGFMLNGVTTSTLTADFYSAGAVAAQRVFIHAMLPVTSVDYVSVAVGSPAASTVDETAHVFCVFLPMA